MNVTTRIVPVLDTEGEALEGERMVVADYVDGEGVRQSYGIPCLAGHEVQTAAQVTAWVQDQFA